MVVAQDFRRSRMGSTVGVLKELEVSSTADIVDDGEIVAEQGSHLCDGGTEAAKSRPPCSEKPGSASIVIEMA